MALPLSGTISMNDIRVELGVPSQSPFSLSAASVGAYATINICSASRPNSTSPYSISEWYGYNHSATCGYEFCFNYSTTDCATVCALGTPTCTPP